MREEQIFHEVLLQPADRRSEFLDEVCAGEAALRERVERLLRAHDNPGSFLQAPNAAAVATIAQAPLAVTVGTMIGSYKLREQIGEGGMGVVYVAEQTEPVQRKVALKIIKPGMASREVVARFEAERQALAMMEHPNIAKVFDGGATENGQPFFVMELVQGLPLTEYCDLHKLDTAQRLELFAKVCRAVHHAHQKGIIHRDLKPSNVLVPQIDGAAVPKVIDFGVAKAIGQKLTQQTVYTQFAQLVGTPLYMSPEQAELGVVDIDTRSDVYSLGVLLYELLTGSPPFDSETLKEASFDDMRRIIREEEPPRPSMRISTLQADLATTVAERRRTDSRQLMRTIRGELDWIVMKCLEKDRNRRYESAISLAADIHRYLSDEPVQASPPSAVYRVRKFILRNQGLVLASSLILLVLISGVAGTTWGLISALAERDQKDLALRTAKKNLRQATQIVDRYLTRVSESTLAEDPTLEPLRNQLLQDALNYYQQFVQQDTEDPVLQADLVAAHMRIAYLVYALDPEADWLTPAQNAFDIMEELMMQNPDLESLASLKDGIVQPAGAGAYLRKPDEAIRIFEKGRSIWQRLADDYPSVAGFQLDLATFLSVLSSAHKLEGRPADARQNMQECCDILSRLVKADLTANQARTELSIALVGLARAEAKNGNLAGAEEAAMESLRLAQVLAAEHPSDPTYREILAWVRWGPAEVYEHAGKFEQAVDPWRERAAGFQELAEDFPTVPRYRRECFWSQQLQGEALWAAGRLDEAALAYGQAWKLGKDIHPYDTLGQALRASFLATCPDPQWRDPQEALRLTTDLIEHHPVIGDHWLARGAALYSVGSWEDAIQALETGKSLPHEPLIAARFILPMAYCQVGDREAARRAFVEADEHIRIRHLQYCEVRRLRAEAERLLDQSTVKTAE